MKYGSVCSGIEAATVAWHPLGWEPSFFSEIEKFPCGVLSHHYPDVSLHGDFTTIGKDDYEPIDLLVGGTPCQSFSIAGLRKGMDDDRGNLALEYLKLAQRLGPKWLVWENVPGVLSSSGGRDFGAFLGGLVELGYGFAYRVLDAQYFGVPQRRRRVFVVGYLGGWRPASAVLFESHSLQGNSAPSREKGKVVAGTLGARTCQSVGVQDATSEHLMVMSSGQANAEITDNLSPALNCNRDGAPIAFPYNAATDEIHAAGKNISPSLRTDPMEIAIQTANTGANGKNYSEEVAPTLDRASPPAVGFAQNQRDEVRIMDKVGALAAKPGMKQQTYIHQHTAVRRLTPTECERLQGFPDGFTAIPWRNKDADSCPDGPRYKALGNSMAVPVMHWIGQRIQMVEDITNGKSHGKGNGGSDMQANNPRSQGIHAATVPESSNTDSENPCGKSLFEAGA